MSHQMPADRRVRRDYPVRAAPDPLADELLPLLQSPFDRAYSDDLPDALGHSLLRERLMARVARSARSSRAFVTVRRDDDGDDDLAPGVRAHLLYARPGPLAGRPGEPRRARVVTLAPGSRWRPEQETCAGGSEWLVMGGTLAVGSCSLEPLDYLRLGPQDAPDVCSAGGAVVYVREGAATAAERGSLGIQTDRADRWADFAPGIRRRLLWRNAGGEAAMLYLAQPGAAVPRHGHRHDEECLMIDGELFLDDVLLRQGDYQLAPVGSVHASVTTDTGALLFAHGDIDLDLLPD